MSEPVTLHARYVFPATGPPIAGGSVTIDAGRIVAVGRGPAHRATAEPGNLAILPGLVNAHTHLEFSCLARPLASPGVDFPQWIRRVVEFRREKVRGDGGGDPSLTGWRQDALRAGLAECLQHGATHVGEIAAPDASPIEWETHLTSPVGVTVFQELLGLSAGHVADLLQRARSHLLADVWKQTGAYPGLSPHAPYTVHPDLLAGLTRLASEAQAPVAMHLAESFDELELLASHSGPLVELLTNLDAWDPTILPRGIRPLDYLQQLARAHRALIVHGSFLDDEEAGFLAARRSHMSVVYCPRTHAYFDHGHYPLTSRLSRGINVCLGTDSRASNPDLSMLAEMRYAGEHHPDVAPATILQMATVAGARALGLDGELGSLDVGKRADLALVRLPEHDADDPHELLMDPDCSIEAVYVRGEKA
jgi:cytosine/adenosine deaminase-related metal-dependent hydrolase